MLTLQLFVFFQCSLLIDSVDAHTPSTLFTNSECWTASAATTYDWNIEGGGGSTPSNNTGPSAPHSGDIIFILLLKVMWVTKRLTSPLLDLTSSPRLSFITTCLDRKWEVYMLRWFIRNMVNDDSIISDQHLDNNDPWLLRSIDLSSFSGLIQVRFRAVSNGSYQGDICLDDIAINYCFSNAIVAGNDLTVCKGDTITLTASGGSSYSWDNGAQNGQALQVYSSTDFVVTGIDATGCSGDTVVVTVNTPLFMLVQT